MQDKAFANSKITFEWNTAVAEIKDTGKGEVTAAVLENLKTGERKELPVEGVFVAIGHTPNTALSPARSTWTPTDTSARTTAPARACPACSPAATCRITSTAGDHGCRIRMYGGH